jgi:hypothetical protein
VIVKSMGIYVMPAEGRWNNKLGLSEADTSFKLRESQTLKVES